MSQKIIFTKKELLGYLTRYTNNLVNNTKNSGIFDVEDGFKPFYANDIKKAMGQTWHKKEADQETKDKVFVHNCFGCGNVTVNKKQLKACSVCGNKHNKEHSFYSEPKEIDD